MGENHGTVGVSEGCWQVGWRFFRSFPQKPRLRATLFTSKAAMDTDLSVTYLRRGMISILDVIAVNLPDVFAAEILPKLDMTDTLNLAQVNKAYNDAVWSADGVRSFEAKIEAHLVRIGMKKDRIIEPMYWAVKFDNVPAVRALLESGVDVNKTLNSQYIKRFPTALYLAAEHGRVATVKLLIEQGADPNNRQIPGRTPLSVAADQSNSLCAMELLKAGADVNLATSPSGNTPLMYAVGGMREGIVALLVHYGADVSLFSQRGDTALTIAEKD